MLFLAAALAFSPPPRSLPEHVSATCRTKDLEVDCEVTGLPVIKDIGVDAMVTPDNQLVLLEFNPEPSMGMWGLTKKEILKGKCPVTDGVPRSSSECVGFTKVYSKRFEAALAAARAERAARAAAPLPLLPARVLLQRRV